MRSALVALALVAIATGCAPVVPSMVGGRTTPLDSHELGGGAAMRIPLGDLAPPQSAGTELEALALSGPGGVSPVAWWRYGFDRGWDVALLAAGASLRAELRGSTPLAAFTRLIVGASAYGGYAWAEPREAIRGGDGARFGALVPVAIGIDMAGAAELWLGVRAGFEHFEGALYGAGVSADALHRTTLRAGPLVGLAVGIRPLHVMVELICDIEHVRGALADAPIERTGVALVPGFALRFRL